MAEYRFHPGGQALSKVWILAPEHSTVNSWLLWALGTSIVPVGAASMATMCLELRIPTTSPYKLGYSPRGNAGSLEDIPLYTNSGSAITQGRH